MFTKPYCFLLRYVPSAGYENGHTFSITMKEGLIDKLELPEGLSLNGKNMMRALASILQVDTTGHEMGMWTKREVWGVVNSVLISLILLFFREVFMVSVTSTTLS